MNIRMLLQKITLLLLLVGLLLAPTALLSSAEEGPSSVPQGEDGAGEVFRSPFAAEEGSLSLACKSAILMEAKTGAILYTQNADEPLPPASVTKIMTLLLVMEAVDAGTLRLDTLLSVSANAASMGGSQVYLKEGERMSVEDLLKSVVIASANDAAVALAEAVAGSVPAFVTRMNQKAERLGMTNTHFENVTGLDDTATNHLTSAHDIAVMSRALISHEEILPYSSTWMDTIRNGEFGLTNTNRLVRFYPGCNGLKTGSTAKAGFCISATAERDGLSLICVIMGAESRDVRNHAASTLLDWGFAEYGLYTSDEEELAPIVLQGGTAPFAAVKKDRFSCVVPKQLCGRVEMRINLPDALSAPISAGEPIGCAEFLLEGRVIGNVPIVAGESVMRIDLFSILRKLAAKFLLI